MNLRLWISDLKREKLIFLIYSVCLIIGALTHEMWTDEARPWIITSDLALADLFRFLKNEFHPPGWYFIVKLLSSLGLPSVSMKLVSATFALLAFRLLLRSSPFSLLQKCLFIGNAYLLYQYGVMARPYSLEVFLLFSLCSIYHDRLEQRGKWFFLITLLALSHAFGLILAPFFLFRNVLDFFQGSGTRKRLIIGSTLTFLLIAGTVLVMDPLGSNLGGILKSSSVFQQRFFQAISFNFQSVFLVLPFGDDWWGRSLFSWTQLPTWPAALLTIPAFYLLFRISRKELFAFFLVAYTWIVLLLILVFYVFAGFNLNHLGQLFLSLICCFWILGKNGGKFFTAILTLQFVAGIIMWNSDVRKPFTTGPGVSSYLSEIRVKNLVADVPYFSSSWIVDSGNQIIFPDGNRRSVPYGDASIMTDMKIENYVLLPFTGLFLRSSTAWLKGNLKAAQCSSKGETLLVTNYPIAPEEMNSLCLQEVKSFERPLNPMENFRIYSFGKTTDCDIRCVQL